MNAISLWREADYLATSNFDYYALRYKENDHNHNGPRAYMTSLAPTLVALMIRSGGDRETSLLLNHLMSIGFATLLVVAIIELLRPSFGTTIAALAAAAVVTMPLVTVQIDIVGMDLMMASATLVCLAALVRGRWWLATLAACGAYALKATGAIATVTVIAFVALNLWAGWSTMPRRERRSAIAVVLVGLLIFCAEVYLVRWGGTMAALLENISEDRDGPLLQLIKIPAFSATLTAVLLTSLALASWALVRSLFTTRPDHEDIGRTARWRKSLRPLLERWRVPFVVGVATVGMLISLTRVETIPRYLTLLAALAMPLLASILSLLGMRRGIIAGILAIICVGNLLGFDSLLHPYRDDPRLVYLYETSTDYRATLRAEEKIFRRLASDYPTSVVVAPPPPSLYLARPNMGYVTKPMRGFDVVGTEIPGWGNYYDLLRERPIGALYVYTGVVPSAEATRVPPPAEADEVLFAVEGPTPLIVYRKRWTTMPPPDREVAEFLASWDGSDSLANRFKVLTLAGLDDLARKELDDRLKTAEVPAPLYATAAGILLVEGRYEEALELCQEGIEACPDSGTLHSLLGSIYLQQGDTEQATVAYGRATQCDPELAEAHAQLGRIALAGGDLDQAEQRLRRAIELRPDAAEWHFFLGNVLLSRREPSGAIAAFENAVAHAPDFLPALNGLAWLLASHPDRSVRDGKRALELSRRLCELTEYNDPTALDTLAAALAETGQFSSAIQYAEQALAHARSIGNAQQAGQISQRLQAYRSALAREPSRNRS